jgi:hypothetical protein
MPKRRRQFITCLDCKDACSADNLCRCCVAIQADTDEQIQQAYDAWSSITYEQAPALIDAFRAGWRLRHDEWALCLTCHTQVFRDDWEHHRGWHDHEQHQIKIMQERLRSMSNDLDDFMGRLRAFRVGA